MRGFIAAALFVALAVGASFVALAQTAPGTFTSPQSQPIVISGLSGTTSCSLIFTGIPGNIDVEGSPNGATGTWSPITSVDKNGGAYTNPYTPLAQTLYYIGPFSYGAVQIRPDPTFSGNTIGSMTCQPATPSTPQPPVNVNINTNPLNVQLVGNIAYIPAISASAPAFLTGPSSAPVVNVATPSPTCTSPIVCGGTIFGLSLSCATCLTTSSLVAGTNISITGGGTTINVIGSPSFANITDTGLGSTSTLPLCAPNNAAIVQCGAGSIPNADLVTNPLTSLVCSANIVCGSGVTPTVQATNAPTFSALLTAGNLLDTGLASTTVTPLCGANATNVAFCTAGQIYAVAPTPSPLPNTAYVPLFATTGNVNKATGAVANTYQQLGANVVITTGTSLGAQGKWLVDVEMPLNTGTAFGAIAYGCISSASTYTVLDASTDGASTCVTALTNSFAGSTTFGVNTSALSTFVKANLSVANATTLTIQCWVAGSTTASSTVYGNCHAKAFMY